MVIKTVSIGTAYDIYRFDDGDTEYGLETSGKIKADTAPTGNDEVVRYQDIPSFGDIVEAAANITDNALVRGDGGVKGVQDSGVIIDDSDNVTGVTSLESTKVLLTPEGGIAVKLTNKTGAASVAGQLVKADTATNDAVVLTAISDTECFGVFYNSGIVDGSEVWVVVAGIADVLFEDNHGPTRGDWVATSATDAGYAVSQASPAAAPTHFEEIGHCIETVAAGGAGTHVAARCVLHFN